MPLNQRNTELRIVALQAALDLHTNIDGDLALERGVSRDTTVKSAEHDVRETGETFFAWLCGTTRITLTRGPITKQNGPAANHDINEENTMQIHDDEQFTLTVDTKDAKGFETADAVTWSADNTDAVTLQVSDDGRSCTVVAGNPGSAVITVTDTSTDPQLSATEAVDVVPGGTATITLTEGDVTKQ